MPQQRRGGGGQPPDRGIGNRRRDEFGGPLDDRPGAGRLVVQKWALIINGSEPAIVMGVSVMGLLGGGLVALQDFKVGCLVIPAVLVLGGLYLATRGRRLLAWVGGPSGERLVRLDHPDEFDEGERAAQPPGSA